ncbi:MAG: HPP family protein [Gammaproteobacteria bacterium]|nr:HPP family protein [Gammaproteobacteria bacterium]
MVSNRQWVLGILGIERQQISHTERLISALGAFVGILVVWLTSALFLAGGELILVVASMGASAVLLFAVPHGTLSQPWPLIGGHVISALIGVSCAQLVSNPYIAAPLAVGLAVGTMHYLRCIHPPGGATALAAVVGGSEIVTLGYGFVIAPVLINVTAILGAAVMFNFLFPWRRYPSYLCRHKERKTHSEKPMVYAPITHEDFVYALSEIDSFIDVTEDDLIKIYELATGRGAEKRNEAQRSD